MGSATGLLSLDCAKERRNPLVADSYCQNITGLRFTADMKVG